VYSDIVAVARFAGTRHSLPARAVKSTQLGVETHGKQFVLSARPKTTHIATKPAICGLPGVAIKMEK